MLTQTEIRIDFVSQFAAWLDQTGRSAKTIAAYLQDLRGFAAWFERENAQPLEPGLVTRIDLQQYRAWSLKTRRVSAATWNRRLASLSVFVDWAQQAGHLEYNPSDGISRVAQQKSAPRWLPRPEMNRLLRTIEILVNRARTPLARELALRDQAIIALLLYAGLREGEVTLLDLADVTLGERSGRVRVIGKGEKERQVPLNAEARRALKMWIEARGLAEGPLFSGAGSDERVSTRLVQRRVAEMGHQAGVDVTPHQLRHTFAKRTIDSGAPLSYVQELLGHERADTTARYTRAGWDDLENAVEW